MATYYVRKTGSDANSGLSAGAAKLTIQAAVNLATTAGDTVYVGAGTYRETVTLAASGSSGNPISLIGDYAGTQTGDAGVVRITGSNDDASITRTNCIAATARSYWTISGFALDMASQVVALASSCTNITIERCQFQGQRAVSSVGSSQANITIRRCLIMSGGSSYGVMFDASSGGGKQNSGNVVENCVLIGYCGAGEPQIMCWGCGGVTIRNCLSLHPYWFVRALSLPVGYTAITVNNCAISHAAFGLHASAAGELVEDYNSVIANTARTNVSTGANSNTRWPLLDPRTWFALTGGGSIVSPFDLASYSALVEYNSGTGAPSTDARGASQTGSYREWGPLEYNAALSVSGGAALGLPVVGSNVVGRGT